MPLRIKCPSGHTLIVPDDRAGRTLTCPRCDQSVVVPAAATQVRSSSGTLSSKPPVPDELISLIAEDIGGSQSSVAVAEKVDLRRSDVTRETARQPSYEDQPARPVVKPKSRILPLPQPPPPAPSPAAPTSPCEVASPQEPAQLPEAPNLEQAIAKQQPLTTTSETPAREANEASHADAAQVAPLPAEAAPTTPQTDHVLVAQAGLPVKLQPHDPIELKTSEPAELQASEPSAPPSPHYDPTSPADEPAPPPFIPRAEPATASLHADAASTLAVYQLVAALVAGAVFSVVPAVWDLIEYLQVAESQFVARWALGLFFLGIVQLAYAVYLFQLPDWTTVWVVTVFSLFVAAIYAAVLGLGLLSPADGFLVGEYGLQLADKLAGGKAALWCLCMVSLSTILAFFAGRLSTRWHKTELLLRACA